MYDLTIELPAQPIAILNRDGVQVATRHGASVDEVAEVIKRQRQCGWSFLQTVCDQMRDAVLVMFKREENG